MQELVSQVALNVMKKRILFKKSTGEQETPLDAYKRVAEFVAKGHEKLGGNFIQFRDKTIEMLSDGKFMPNTPTLVNAGFPNAQCSACFVLPVEDALDSIYQAHRNQGLIQSSGGGVGFNLSNIRSAGTLSRDRFVTKGPISWLKLLNENAGHVAQGMREGANIAILDIGHPDIVDFIECKNSGYNLSVEDLSEQFGTSIEEAKRIRSVIGIEKFNISISITDKFMDTLENNGDWYLIDPHTKKRMKSIPAKKLWDLIVEHAHQHGEPGIFFVDEVNRYNKLPKVGRIESTNPCGEIPLHPYGSCTLGHVNLSKFVIGSNGTSQINYTELENTIRFGIQFLDNIVEVNTFPLPELTDMNKNSRRIGLGVMGWADALIKMGVAYDSDDAIDRAHNIGSFFNKIAMDESQKLGKDRGNFPLFDGSTWSELCTYMRNSDITTIAPTGQTSMYVGCSSGIEPIMFPVMKREQAGMIQADYHPLFLDTLNKYGLNTPEVTEKIGILGSVRKAIFLPEKIRDLFPCAHDIHYSWHIKHQAEWQKHITTSISKTINLSKDTTVEDVNNAYLMAYKSHCKGVTVYRDGSRMNQPLSSLANNKKLAPHKNRRSEVTRGTNRKIQSGCGNLMIFVGEGEDGNIQEITARLGKGGSCSSAQVEAIGRMASIAIQHGADPKYVAKQLCSIRCHLSGLHKSKYTGDRPRVITSCGDAMSVALSEHLLNGSGRKLEGIDKLAGHSGACPECGGQLVFEEGCSKCYNCQYSRC